MPDIVQGNFNEILTARLVAGLFAEAKEWVREEVLRALKKRQKKKTSRAM